MPFRADDVGAAEISTGQLRLEPGSITAGADRDPQLV